MTKMILATENFPYGKGEKTFILPELERLRQYYDIIILSHANLEQQNGGMSDEIPEGIQVVNLGRPRMTVWNKCRAFFSFFADEDGRTELREILKERTDIKTRLYQSLSFYAQAFTDQKQLRQFDKLFREETVIYYSFWYTYFCYSMVREKERYPGVKMITRTHGIDLYHERIPGGRQPFRHQMEEKVDAIVFSCKYGAQYYEANVKDKRTRKDKLHVCKLGIEMPARQMPVSTEEEWELLSCSNVIPLKRIRLIVDGLAQIEKKKIHWTHIGDGSELQKIREYAEQKLGTKNNIRFSFKGFVKDVRSYYVQKQVDCFITTSATEGGCPVSIQEAMSYGIPVIGTDVGGITEMIADNGILLPANPDADDIAGAIQKIAAQDREDLQKMKEAAYLKWQLEFDIDRSFHEIYEVLNNL